MSKEKRREIASKGGKAAHKMGRAHEWTGEEAQRAGGLRGRSSDVEDMEEMNEDWD